MAEAFLRNCCKKIKTMSAGVEPDKKVHPWTIKVMKEIGLDVSQQKPKKLTKNMIKNSDKTIVMDSDLLKEIPKHYLSKIGYWQIEKLRGKSLEDIRKIRDDIKKKVDELTQKL